MTAQELGRMGEIYVARKLADAGLSVTWGDGAGPDLYAEGLALEIKAARVGRYRSDGRRGYQFCLHRQGRNGVQAAAVILLCYWDAASDPVAFVIPAERVGRRRKLVIPSRWPWTYEGRWARWYRRWETLADLMGVCNA